jgi:hypothetical protein
MGEICTHVSNKSCQCFTLDLPWVVQRDDSHSVEEDGLERAGRSEAEQQQQETTRPEQQRRQESPGGPARASSGLHR